MFHNTPDQVSPAVKPHPQPRPVPDNTVASATQFAVGDDDGGLGAVDVGVGVGAVVVGAGERTSVHAERSRTTPSVMGVGHFMTSPVHLNPFVPQTVSWSQPRVVSQFRIKTAEKQIRSGHLDHA